MSHQFKEGDKVTVREGATSVFGHKRDPNEIRTVAAPRRSVAGNVLLDGRGDGTPGNLFRPEDLILVTSAQPTVIIEVGQEWFDRSHLGGPGVIVEEVTGGSVRYRWNDETGIRGNRSVVNFLSLFGPVTPDPFDVAKVKAGDTVEVRVEEGYAFNPAAYTINGTVWKSPHGPLMIGPLVLDQDLITLTDHQPAPEPEPAKPAPGTFGTAVVKGERQRGLIDEDGDFDYTSWDGGYVSHNYTNDFADFKPYSEDE